MMPQYGISVTDQLVRPQILPRIKILRAKIARVFPLVQVDLFVHTQIVLGYKPLAAVRADVPAFLVQKPVSQQIGAVPEFVAALFTHVRLHVFLWYFVHFDRVRYHFFARGEDGAARIAREVAETPASGGLLGRLLQSTLFALQLDK